MNRATRRKVARGMRPGVQVPTEKALRELRKTPGAVGELARLWLRFPETTRRNIASRVNRLDRRRAANRRARISRKRNRRSR